MSWRGAETLKRSLESYSSAGLFEEFTQCQIFLPDPDDAVLEVCSNYDVSIKTIPKNLGIMENMAAAATNLDTNYIVMLENDCPLIEPLAVVRRQISKSLELLQREDVIMSRLRSIEEPGQAFLGLDKYRRLFDGTLRAKLTRALRPDKVRRLTGYALYDGPHAISRHSHYFEPVDDRFYLVDTAVMPWTNQSILINRQFFLKEIIPLARSVKTGRHANHKPNLEIELNKSRVWKQSNWKIACGPGLFTHERIGDRGYT